MIGASSYNDPCMEALAIKTGHKRTKLRFFPLLIVVNQKAQAGCEIISSLHLRVGAQNVGILACSLFF